MVKIYRNFNKTSFPEEEVYIKDGKIIKICGYEIDDLLRKNNVYYLAKKKEYFYIKTFVNVLISIEFGGNSSSANISNIYVYVEEKENVCALKENVDIKDFTMTVMSNILKILPFTEKEARMIYLDNLLLKENSVLVREELTKADEGRRFVKKAKFQKTFFKDMKEVQEQIDIFFKDGNIIVYDGKEVTLPQLYRDKKFLNEIKNTNVTQNPSDIYTKCNFMTIEQAFLRKKIEKDLIYKGMEYSSVSELVKEEFKEFDFSTNYARITIRIIREGLGCSLEKAVDILKEYYEKRSEVI